MDRYPPGHNGGDWLTCSCRDSQSQHNRAIDAHHQAWLAERKGERMARYANMSPGEAEEFLDEYREQIKSYETGLKLAIAGLVITVAMIVVGGFVGSFLQGLGLALIVPGAIGSAILVVFTGVWIYGHIAASTKDLYAHRATARRAHKSALRRQVERLMEPG